MAAPLAPVPSSPRRCEEQVSRSCGRSPTSSTTRGSTRRRCGSTTAEQLAERTPPKGPMSLIVESRLGERPGPRPAASGCRRRPAATPTTSTSPARPRPGIPVLNAPGRNADAVAEMAAGPALRRQPPHAGRRRRRARRRSYAATAPSRISASGRGRSPARRPGWSASARWAGRCTGACRPRPARHLLRPLQRRGHPQPRRPAAPSPTSSRMHAPVTPETTGMIGAEQFAAMHDGAVFINTRPGPAARHRRPGRGAAQRQGWPPRVWTTSSASGCPPTTP